MLHDVGTNLYKSLWSQSCTGNKLKQSSKVNNKECDSSKI